MTRELRFSSFAASSSSSLFSSCAESVREEERQRSEPESSLLSQTKCVNGVPPLWWDLRGITPKGTYFEAGKANVHAKARACARNALSLMTFLK